MLCFSGEILEIYVVCRKSVSNRDEISCFLFGRQCECARPLLLGDSVLSLRRFPFPEKRQYSVDRSFGLCTNLNVCRLSRASTMDIRTCAVACVVHLRGNG